MSTLRLGKLAPDFEAVLPGGRSVSLADYQDRTLLLIFLRHLT